MKESNMKLSVITFAILLLVVGCNKNVVHANPPASPPAVVPTPTPVQTQTGGNTSIGGQTTTGNSTPGSGGHGGGPGIVYNTTLAAESAVNVAGCATAPQPWCATSFPGWTDTYASSTTPPAAAIITNPPNPVPFRITAVRGVYDVHKLTTSKALIMAHTQWWFDNSGTGTTTRDGVTFPYNGNVGHLKVGHTDNQQAYTDAVVNDMWNRGIDGIFGNWGGGQNDCGYPSFTTACSFGKTARDQAYQKLMTSFANLHPSMKFAFVYDSSSFSNSDNCTATAASGANQPKCVQGKIDADLDWATTQYFNKPQYARFTIGGVNKYVLLFFVDEHGAVSLSQCTAAAPCNLTSGTCTSSTACWQSIWDGVQSHMVTKGFPVAMVFENNGGFTHRDSSGAFDWSDFNSAQGGSITTATQLDYDRSGTAIETFYTNGKNNPTKLAIGALRKGNDMHLASWHYPLGEVTAQQCGQVWLHELAKANGTTAQYIQIPTWDDYEEGSEIETGIDNCYNAPTLAASGTTVTITLNPTSTKYSGTAVSNSALQNLDLFVSVDGVNLFLLDTLPSPTTTNTTSFDMADYGQLVTGTTYRFFVRQNGKPGLKSIMSASLSVTR